MNLEESESFSRNRKLDIDYRAILRHGVSTVHSGERYALGIIFHDAN
jgi:hypothetical protein